MAKKPELKDVLLGLEGKPNVYLVAPESIKMTYPAIKVSLRDMPVRYANNAVYKQMNRYELIFITRDFSDPIVAEILKLQYCKFDRYYSADTLHHFVFTLYY